MPPKVTLIIPTFNRAHLLTRALDSALSQVYPTLDFIIDNSSSDNTLEALESHFGNLRSHLVGQDHNCRVAAAKTPALHRFREEAQCLFLL